MFQTTLFYLAVAVSSFFGVKGQKVSDPTEIQEFLDNYHNQSQIFLPRLEQATWNYYMNLTGYNQKIWMDEDLLTAKFKQEASRNATRFNLTVMTPEKRRMMIKLMDIGTAAQTNETKLSNLSNVIAVMTNIQSTAKVPTVENQGNYDEFLAAWLKYRAETGGKIKKMYAEYVELSNEAVKILGHADLGAYWRSWYETPTFEDDVRSLFDHIRPLYEQLHAYARRKLQQRYGNVTFPSSGHVPAHLRGEMWSPHELTPFKGKPSFDVTDEMVRQNYTALRIFQIADDFFKSLGMIPMPETFWNKSLFERPKDGRDMVCIAGAWDFYDGKDFRLQQCTVITTTDLETAHHEMGHIQTFLQYKDQPVMFRGAANPGFHEAIGDVIGLSVRSPDYMHSIGLIPTVCNDTECDINFLMSIVLRKIVLFPFVYLAELWRWSVFRGDTTSEKYNEHWWNLSCRYDGFSSPVPLSSSEFAPGAIYHIAASVPAIRYCVGLIVQFQFHKALCDEAGYRGPLHRCNIYNSTAAGTLLSNMLKLGSSKPWPEAMYLLTGQYKMDVQPLKDYFKPLLDYLRKENGNDYGWHPICPTFHSKTTPEFGVNNNNTANQTCICY